MARSRTSTVVARDGTHVVEPQALVRLPRSFLTGDRLRGAGR